MKKMLKYLFRATLLATIFVAIWLPLTMVSTDELPELKTGDIVLQAVNTPQTIAIMAASTTLYSHTGVVNVGTDGVATVVEAAGPVREVSLKDWIDQGVAGRITIKRMPNLSDEQANQIVAAARKHNGKPYDFLFRFDRESIYCSELVYYAFQDGAAIDLGKVEQVSDLNVNNFAVRNIIEQRWQDHPVCVESGADSFEACYDIIMQQKLITPVSVADDPRLELIFSNYSPF